MVATIISAILVSLLFFINLAPKKLYKILYKIFFDDRKVHNNKYVERRIFNIIVSILVLLLVLQITCLILDI